MNKTTTILFTLTTLFLCINCSSNKSHSEKTPTFILSEASFVKIFPGERDKAIKLKLSFTMNEMQENTKIDSIYFRNNVSKSIVESKDSNNLYYCILNVSIKLDLNNSLENLKPNEAYVFYSIKQKNYYFKLENIIEKESIYLP